MATDTDYAEASQELSEGRHEEGIKTHQPPKNILTEKSHFQKLDEYQSTYAKSINDTEEFWEQEAKKAVTWFRPFTKVLSGSLQQANVAWFPDGELNVCYNCVDRHAFRDPNKIAIISEGDEPGTVRKISFGVLLDQVCRIANALKSLGVRKGDVVAIYMPMIPEAAFTMLACTRIGAVHSVVFGGFSSDALRDRINDARCKLLITADQGKRGGKRIHLKKIADEAVAQCPSIQHVLVYEHTGDSSITMNPKDVKWADVVDTQRPFCPAESMSAEDPLFVLYTSGSTGKPKGLVHTTGGYLVSVNVTVKYTFDLQTNDIFGCVADVGWITGHSYIVYGPLSNGTTTVMFESIPTYPDAGRYWKMIQDHKITQFYTAPTAIRALKRLGDSWITKYDLSSLRVIGTVGEPINPEAWNWYNQVVGRFNCAVVDTYWQTETGSFLLAPYATITPTKPGSCTQPQFGILPVILDASTGKVMEGKNVSGVLAIGKPWPSMARTILNDHQRFVETYLKPYPGLYFTGDGCHRDMDGYYWIRGRVDDVINVSGHRLSTAEIESALVCHQLCAEAAVIGAADDISGQAVVAFCTVKPEASSLPQDQLKAEFIVQVRKSIGPFSAPKRVYIVPELPKTRSGKIMRRILRKIVANETEHLGDLSTLADPSVIETLVKIVEKSK